MCQYNTTTAMSEQNDIPRIVPTEPSSGTSARGLHVQSAANTNDHHARTVTMPEAVP